MCWVSPCSALGPQTFQFTHPDPNGYTELASLHGRFNASASDAGACSFRYDRASNYLYLWNAAGNGTTPTLTTNWVTSEIPLREGANTLTVRARDAGGNVGWRSVVVTRRRR
jgi:hypothetical protein